MKRIKLLIPVIMLLVGIVALSVATFGLDYRGVYERYHSTPLPELCQEANSVMLTDPERAVMMYSVVCNSYSGKLGKEDMNACMSAFNNMGYLHFFEYNDYVKAYDCFLRAKEIGELLRDRYPGYTPGGAAYLNLGNVHAYYNEFDKGRDYFKRGFEESELDGNGRNSQVSLMNLLSLALNGSAQPDSIKDFLLSLRGRKFQKAPLMETNRRLLEAYRLLAAERPYESAQMAKEALNCIDDEHYPERVRMSIMDNIVHLLESAGRNGEALDTLRSMGRQARLTGHPDFECVAYNGLADLFGKMGMKDSAAKYRLAGLEISDSLFNPARLSSIKDLEASYNMRKADEHIGELIRERRTRNMIIAIGGVAFVAIAVLLGLVARAYSQMRRRNEELYTQVERQLEAEQRWREERRRNEERVGELQSRLAAFEQPEAAAEDKEKEKYAGSTLKEDDKAALYEKICRVMEESEEIYGSDFTVDRLAVLVDSKTRYVSQTINELSGKNFATFVGTYRIREACRRISDHPELTIEAVAQSVGFKSRSTFAMVFRREVGLNPKEFQKISQSKKGK